MDVSRNSVEWKGHLAKDYFTKTFENFLKINIKFAQRF